MERIEVGRYKHPESHGWAGWLHPERSPGEVVPPWALFITVEGHLSLGVRDEQGELVFSEERGPSHPRMFTREAGDPEP